MGLLCGPASGILGSGWHAGLACGDGMRCMICEWGHAVTVCAAIWPQARICAACGSLHTHDVLILTARRLVSPEQKRV